MIFNEQIFFLFIFMCVYFFKSNANNKTQGNGSEEKINEKLMFIFSDV